MSENVGYLRVSTRDQNLFLQEDAMARAGVTKLFRDEGVSGGLASRPGLDAALDYMREGDTLVVFKLDRLGRNTVNVLTLLDALSERGIQFRSLTEGISTEGAMGKLMLTIMSAFAQMEKDQLKERTSAGLAAARARGKVGGRKAVLSTTQHKMIRSLYDARELTVDQIAEQFKVSRPTVYRSLATTAPVAAEA
ncbi:DNA invertase Pin-like site-specific DNA recombinase [Rathayibacter agropyri]